MAGAAPAANVPPGPTYAMGVMDSLPVVSQYKCAFIAIIGAAAGLAGNTRKRDECMRECRARQNYFSQTCPTVSVYRCAVELALGDTAAAMRTLKTQGKAIRDVAHATPVVGHAAAIGYAAAGKTDRAKEVANKATKTSVVVAAAVGVGLAFPPAAPAAALSWAVGYDAAHSAITKKPQGYVAIGKAVKDGTITMGTGFDLVVTLGAAGVGAAAEFPVEAACPDANVMALSELAPAVVKESVVELALSPGEKKRP